MSDYLVKLEAIREYEEALRLRNVYQEAIEISAGLLKEIVTECQRSGYPIPPKIEHFIHALAESDETLQVKIRRKSDGDLPEPQARTPACSFSQL